MRRARRFWPSTAWSSEPCCFWKFVVNGEDDPVFAKALEVLRDWERYGSGITY